MRSRLFALLLFAFVSPAPGETETACVRGAALMEARAFREAQDALWQCVLPGAPDREGAYRLAQTYREVKNYGSGLERARKALKQNPASTDLLYINAFLEFRTGRHKESIELLGRAFRIDKYDWRVHHLSALNYVVLDLKDGALEGFRSAVALNPRSPELHYHLARHYYSNNRIEESMTSSRTALRLLPGYPDVLVNLAFCYRSLGDMGQARAHFEMAIEASSRLKARDEWPFINYASFLIEHEEMERSLQLLGEALTLNPQSARARYYLGRIYRKLGRNREAREQLEQSIALDPTDAPAFYELGLLKLRQGDREGGNAMLARFEALKRSKPRQ
ncbi:MAG: tetratricopeptide repeat protein [Bryobacteraceae bacterium]